MPATPPVAHIRPVSPHDPAAQRLLRASDEYMAALYPPQSNHLEPAAALSPPHAQFFGAFVADELVACGAFKRMDDDGIYAEVKRVFVDSLFRGRGLAGQMMEHVESRARASGLVLMRLETGIHQPEALRLYRRLGYRLRGPFGKYRPDPLSLFMEKQLGDSA